MKIPNVTIQQLLEAGVHLGHKTLRWNPKMKKYIFGKRDSIHIIDLTQTLELTKTALEKVFETISNNGKILFVSTKKQASEAIAEVAKETTVMPIINFGIFRFIEIAKEPSKRYSPPFIRKNKPIIIAKKSILELIASYV